MKKEIFLGIFIFIFILFISSVHAVDKSASVKGATTTSAFFGNYSPSIAGSDTAEGGNITSLNLTADSSTFRWQGYFGTVSATLHLGVENSSAVLYDFGSASRTSIKTVLASTNSSFNFAILDSGNSNGTDVDTAWGWADAADNATSILNDTNLYGEIASLSSVQIINLTSYDSDHATIRYDVYGTGVFNDSTITAGAYNNLAYGVNVTLDQYDFMNSSVIDYELVVPVNITSTGASSTQTYYFFLDIV